MDTSLLEQVYPPKGENRQLNDLDCYRLRIVLLVLLQHSGVNLNIQRLSKTLTIIHISPEEVAELTHLDIFPYSTQRSCDRFCGAVFLGIIQNPPEIASLGVVILIAGIVAICDYIS
jgi:hypothetical protein